LTDRPLQRLWSCGRSRGLFYRSRWDIPKKRSRNYHKIYQDI